MKAEDRYDSLIQFYAEEKKIDWHLLKAQVRAESNFNPNAQSPVKALGLAQFMKATWEEWKDGTPGTQLTQMLFDRTNPEHSIRAQAAYMCWLLNYINSESVFVQQKYDAVKWALAAYNWGIGRVIRLMKTFERFENALPLMPEETRNYVKRINSFIESYKNIDVNLISNDPDNSI